MKTEWWYESAIFDLDQTTIALARLVVREDGTAQILTDGGEVLEFEKEDEAEIWLTSEEYRPLESLLEQFQEEGIPVDPRIQAPTAVPPEDLVRQMVIKLTPARPPALTEIGQPHS
jgi:hypothetical protein